MIVRTLRLICALLFCFVLSTFSFAQFEPGGHGDGPTAVKIASDKTVVPMELVNRQPVIEIKINGKGPFKFFLDTASSATVMDQSLANDLALTSEGTAAIGDPTDPHGINANRNRIAKLEIGGATFADVAALSWEHAAFARPGGPQGVVGMPLFRQLLLTIDYPAGKVAIERGSLKKGPNVIEYSRGRGESFMVPVKIGSSEYLANLDTASGGGLWCPNDYMDKLSLADKPHEAGRARTVSGEAVLYEAKLKDAVSFGGHSFEAPNVTFFDRLKEFNIGYELISQFAITIDQENGRIRFAKTAAAASPSVPLSEKPASGSSSNEFTGVYGVRKIIFVDGQLFLQRISGPQGTGPNIKLTEVSKDTYSVEGVPGPRVKFVRNPDGKVVELQVQNRDGNWESAKREN